MVLFDGQTNDWFYEYTDDGGATAEFGTVMFGPGYNTKGAHVYPSNNTILKGTGDHHIVDSIISDNGSTVFVAGTLEAENILAQVAFTGDLIGTASYADFATTASHVPGIISAGLVSGLGTDAMRSSDDLTTTAPVASGDYSIALGDSSNASATDTISIGRSAVSALADGVAIGHEAVTSNNNSLALGRGASATGSYSLAINANNAPVLNVLTTNQDAIFSAAVSASAFSGSFFGNGSGLTDVGGLVSGTGTDSIQSAAFLTAAGAADASGDEAVAIGRDAQATAIDSVGIGTQAGATGNKSIAIGEASQASTVAVAIGRLADASTYGATAVGQQASATGQRSAAYGFQAETDNDYGLALGNAADATGNIAFALNFNQAAAMTGTTSNQDVYFQGGIEASGSVRGIVDDLSIVSNVATMDCSTGNFFTLTLQNATSTQLTATNIQEGQTINLKITQNATSAGDLTFDTMFEFEGGTAFVPSAAISEVDVMTFISFDGTSLQATGLKNFS